MKMFAPAKIMIAGEYSVLLNRPALVMSIDRFASCRYEPEKILRFFSQTTANFIQENSPLVNAVLTICQQEKINIPPGSYYLDSSAFFSQGKKIGLGSSAAITVALLKTILKLHHSDDFELLFRLSDRSHRLFNGGLGSGADIAASVYGGLILFQKEPLLIERQSLCLDDLLIINTGRSQKTNDFVKEFLRAEDNFVDEFAEESTKIIEKLIAHHNDEKILIPSFDALGLLLEELGEKLGIAIVTKEHREIARLARAHQGAAKPSGAGGGDIAIALLPTEQRKDFCQAIEARGFSLIQKN